MKKYDFVIHGRAGVGFWLVRKNKTWYGKIKQQEIKFHTTSVIKDCVFATFSAIKALEYLLNNGIIKLTNVSEITDKNVGMEYKHFMEYVYRYSHTELFDAYKPIKKNENDEE